MYHEQNHSNDMMIIDLTIGDDREEDVVFPNQIEFVDDNILTTAEGGQREASQCESDPLTLRHHPTNDRNELFIENKEEGESCWCNSTSRASADSTAEEYAEIRGISPTETAGSLCAICFDHLSSDIGVTGCGHCFHRLCYEKWDETSRRKFPGKSGTKCPSCNESVNTFINVFADISQLQTRSTHKIMADVRDIAGEAKIPIRRQEQCSTNGNSAHLQEEMLFLRRENKRLSTQLSEQKQRAKQIIDKERKQHERNNERLQKQLQNCRMRYEKLKDRKEQEKASSLLQLSQLIRENQQIKNTMKQISEKKSERSGTRFQASKTGALKKHEQMF